MNELLTFGEQLARSITAPNAGTRLQSVSAASGASVGNAGPGELTTRPTPEGRTQREWLVGDPMGAGAESYFFKDFRYD